MVGWIKATIIGISALTTATALVNKFVRDEAFEMAPRVEAPPMTSIVVPTYKEAKLLRVCLNTLEAQTIRREYPDRFEVIVVDSGSDDGTVQIAHEYTGKVLRAPLGKLTARDRGIMLARGNVIVGVDADTYYPPNYLNVMLRNFRPGVVGVSSPRLYGHPMRDSNFVMDAVSLWKAVFDGLEGKRMPGSNNAFLRSAYFEAGGFDLSINQFHGPSILQEEEYDFPERLRRLGNVVWEWKAPSFTSARRYFAKKVERTWAPPSTPRGVIVRL
jgi:glycosyltransferase involved in cell wall biosynthesis